MCNIFNRLFAADSKEKELQHGFLLQALAVLRDALHMMEQLQHKVQTATNMIEVRIVYLFVFIYFWCGVVIVLFFVYEF